MPVNQHCCARCAIPLPATAESAAVRLCGSCLHTPPPFDRVIAPWLYEEYLAHLIHQWKFHRERRMTALLAALWQQRAELHTPVDLLVPVPLHWRKRWQRGFNQSELLCRELRATCPALKSCNIAHRLVRRQRSTAAQAGMNARQRASNLKGAFKVYGSCDNAANCHCGRRTDHRGDRGSGGRGAGNCRCQLYRGLVPCPHAISGRLTRFSRDLPRVLSRDAYLN